MVTVKKTTVIVLSAAALFLAQPLNLAQPRTAHAATLDTTTTPYPGVVYQVWVDNVVNARIHVAVIDLSSAEISLSATTEPMRGSTVSSYASAVSAQIAINGDFFTPAGFVPDGLAMGDASTWSVSSDDDKEGFLRFDRNNDVNTAVIYPPEQVVLPADLPTGTQLVVGGRPMLVRTGVAVTSFDCSDLIAMPCERAPRSAVAMSADGKTMWLVVVDGWQQSSLGMTASELGAFLDSLNVHDALMLDGGSSSTLYIAGAGGVVSSPSDGVERVVANHLAVRHGPLPPGQLLGLIRERDITDGSANIEGALVELDTGESMVTGSDALYSFSGLTPRLVCVTASKVGYQTKTQCKQVPSNDMTFNSIALFPNSDFIDGGAGVVDAGISDARIPVDSRPIADGGMTADAGGGGGGGCTVGSTTNDGGNGLATLLVFGVVLLARRRRRS